MGRLHEADSLGLPGSRHVCETHKINFAITWKNLSPASLAKNSPCNRDCRANTFPSRNFASEKNGSPEDRYFSFYITHNDLSEHKAT